MTKGPYWTGPDDPFDDDEWDPNEDDDRKNPRENRGEDSCMVVAVPVVVGIGLVVAAVLKVVRR